MMFIPMCFEQKGLGNIIKDSKIHYEWDFCFRSEKEIETHKVILIHSKLKNKITLIHNGNRMYQDVLKDKFIFQWIIDEFYNKAMIYIENKIWKLQVNNVEFQEGYSNLQEELIQPVDN
ncbi:unnamed protein product [Paramecium pentaurelia]|uniref:Uncharacterized protein n=1 Tax=Paramecium pentaurelia TaxID=43138 RepID=A0A8S1S9V3_9CILI|nr:unnamed protein product [Paramecium pentaurelia]